MVFYFYIIPNVLNNCIENVVRLISVRVLNMDMDFREDYDLGYFVINIILIEDIRCFIDIFRFNDLEINVNLAFRF